ncbi:MAG: type IVB secretion system protein IcmV [Gammaproteobacteria bacterium]
MKTTTDQKKSRKPFFNIREWMGWNQVSEGGKAIKAMAISLFTAKQPTFKKESFEDALARLQMTEADVLIQIKNFQRLLALFFLGAVSLLGYALYLLFIARSYAAALASFGLTAFLLGQVFRYHFWLFQMKQRKLGCSFKEWAQHLLLGPSKKEVIQK